jgi:hypothetical protein
MSEHQRRWWWPWPSDPIVSVATALLAFIAFSQLREMWEENRPVVGFEIVQSNAAKPGEPLTALIAIKNAGKSTALNVHASIETKYLKHNSEDAVAECKACSHALLLPGLSAYFSPVMSREMTDYKKNNLSAPAFLGRVDYEDVAGRRYWTTTCRYYEIENNSLSSCAQGDNVGSQSAFRMGSILNWLAVVFGLLSAALWFLSAMVSIPTIGKSIDDLDRVADLTNALQRQSTWSKWAAGVTGLAVLAGVVAQTFG